MNKNQELKRARWIGMAVAGVIGISLGEALVTLGKTINNIHKFPALYEYRFKHIVLGEIFFYYFFLFIFYCMVRYRDLRNMTNNNIG